MAAVGVLVATLVATCSSLVPEEVAQFGTTGITESNTGLVGTVSITSQNDNHVLTSNGIPDHQTGTFPSHYNPNTIKPQNFRFEFPKQPAIAPQISCLPQGPIAIATNGVPIFNPFTSGGFNAVEGENAEEFDVCNGHPDQTGVYHYHSNPSCLSNPGPLVGVALDGFPIYGSKDENGNTVTSADLDECNGRTVNGRYRYHVTSTFPYVMGCYKGTRPGAPPPGECKFAINTELLSERAQMDNAASAISSQVGILALGVAAILLVN